MSWFIKPFNKSMIWLGEAVNRYTIFGIKVFWIILYVGVLFTTITLADAIYDKGYRAGMETINEK